MIDETPASLLQGAIETINQRTNDRVERHGQLLEAKDIAKVVVVGDLHTEMPALKAIINACQDELRQNRTLVCLVGDLVSNVNPKDFHALVSEYPSAGRSNHQHYRINAGKRAYELLLYAAQLKTAYPHNFHILAGNAELAWENKRATRAFASTLLMAGTTVEDEASTFLKSFPLFMKLTIGGRVYLISHGGVVDTHMTTAHLASYPHDLEAFQRLCYSNDKAPPRDILATSDALGVTIQVFGHYHVFGEKAPKELPSLHLTVPTSGTAAYGHTAGATDESTPRIHVINSMDWVSPAPYLELTSSGVALRNAPW